jgi:hypothetical protein
MRIPSMLVAALVAGSLVGAAPANASEAGTGFVARLSGANEVPAGTGDPDAMGIALLGIKPGEGRICYVMRVRDAGTVTAAHLHAGKAGAEGPAVAQLSPPGMGGAVAACTKVGKKLAAKIRKSPRKYYINLHTADYADGAVRGQLERA